ncbi:membrane-bound PQQ-dependent dehydrogenase, glucose/quinate/shikimate family [Carnimonas nigrificans]|uniref:membrane-bound PQQ-dependent dehydrogenase, glucose/quinate/shikimate family n=1 Tax=Carnimonas nigrificans TaxID=64323 RepID=UPI00046FFBC8|nr:membrane-bound PQQ-dependent dehydrogenase, glucose/quinate/shikimate family [Carnimonas nigrificans]
MQKNGVMSIIVRLIGVVEALMGIGLAAGGAYLVSQGDTWAYLLLGVLLALAGIGVICRKGWALWVALITLVVSVIWAFSEVGNHFWQIFPRINIFLGVALVTALVSPWLRKGDGSSVLDCKVAGGLSVILAAIFGINLYQVFQPHAEIAASGGPAKVLDENAGKASGNDWPAWGRTVGGDKYAQFEQINRDTVKNLKVAWTYRTGDMAIDGAEYQVNPIKVDNTLYLCTPFNKIIALDPVTGKQKWKYDPQSKVTESTREWKRCRGVSFADLSENASSTNEPQQNENASNGVTAGQCRKRIVSTTIDARIFEVDAETGELCTDFGNNGFVDLTEGLSTAPEEGSYNVTSAPLVADGVIMVGGRMNDNLSVDEPSGVVRGYDVRTGKLLWAWDPQRGASDSTPLPPGQTYAKESPNFWGTAAYDPKLGLAFFPTGNQTPDFWTGNRHDYSNEYNDAVVAVDIKTGKERWHFRTANIDQFDYDVSTQPILYDMPQQDGSTIPVLIQGTKRGEIFVLDRRTGKPVVPVEHRPVATDAMPGMQVASTQPFSKLGVGTDPLKSADMWGATIFDQMYCRAEFNNLRWKGPFTPLSDKQETLIWPGYYGGQNWGGGALDPTTGILYVNDIRMAMTGRFLKREDAAKAGLSPSTEGEYSEQLGTPWGVERRMFLSPLGTPCFKPPFGSMTAIDLNSQKTLWNVPIGGIKDATMYGIFKNGFKPNIDVPIGMPTMGGPLVTKGGLTFFEGSLDNFLRAYDNDSGKEVWRSRLPVGAQGSPVTYVAEDGKQYIIVVAGGATRTGTNENRGDYVIAYSLDDK